MENNTTHTSITQCPVNFEKCSVCDGQLPPGIPRMFTVEIPASGPHKSTFRHIQCGVPASSANAVREPGLRHIPMMGLVFSCLTVIGDAGNVPGQTAKLWRCRCSCGKELNVNGGSLRQGKTRSCGHARSQLIAETKRRIPTFTRREGAA